MVDLLNPEFEEDFTNQPTLVNTEDQEETREEQFQNDSLFKSRLSRLRIRIKFSSGFISKNNSLDAKTFSRDSSLTNKRILQQN